MTRDEKAQRYEDLLRANDEVQRKISHLKSENAGINLSEATLKEIAVLEQQQQNIVNQTKLLYDSQ